MPPASTLGLAFEAVSLAGHAGLLSIEARMSPELVQSVGPR